MNENYFSDNIKDGVKSKNVKSKSEKKSVSVSTLIITIITTIVFVFIIVNKWPNIMNLVGREFEAKVWNSNDFNVWDEFAFTWNITDDWDIINYTHVILSLELGKIGIKSSKINLNNYSNEVYLEGIVEKTYQWMPIISVDTIYSLSIVDELLTWDDLSWEDLQSQYLSNVWLYFNSDFFNKYSFINKWESWILKVKDLDTNQIVSLSYFKCAATNDQNCDRFNKMFAESSSQKFVDSLWVTYYKQLEINSWFFSNWDLFWYFVNDIDEAIFKDMVKYITVVNSKFIEKNILDNISILCRDWWKSIKKITDKSISIKNNEIHLLLEWNDGAESKLSCELKIDPTLKNMAKLVELKVIWDFKSEEEIKKDNDWDLDFSVSYDWNSDVTQFPINLEKSLKFTSRKWYSFVFPSSNISYVAQNSQEDFNQVGVNCFSVMNVVQYSDKEFVEQKWNVKIYECTAKNGIDDSDKKLIYKHILDKHFVIEIVDPAWVNFAKNIEINFN